MKKSLWVLFAALASSLMFAITAFAGDINSAEQKIIDAINQTYEYNGAYYKITDEYIAKVIEYLSRDDVNLSNGEANSYIRQFNENIAVGIESGYFIKVGEVEKSPSDGDGDSVSGNGNSSNKGSSNKKGNNSGTGTDNDTNPFGQSISEDGVVEDNTTGSTVDGEMEYVVLPIDTQTMYVWDTETLDVHSEAYKDSPVVGTLKKGDAVTVIGAATTGWAQIQYGDSTAYISAVYLRTQSFMNELKAAEEAKKAEEEAKKAAEEAQKAKEEEERKKKEAEEAARAKAKIEAAERAKAKEEAEKAKAEKENEKVSTDDIEVESLSTEAILDRDYSDAHPISKSPNLGVIALAIVIIVAAGAGGVFWWHRNKIRKR